MKLKSAVLLAFALCCGLVAMLGVQQLVSKNNKSATVSKKKILVASGNIDAGTPLDDTKVKFVDWPASSIPAGAITKPDEFDDRALLTQAYEGTPILATMLGEKGQFGASMAIPVGFRLISIPVNETKTNSGQLRPGDRVDILVTYKNKSVQTTKTLLEYIEVFSVDSHRTVDGNKGEVKTKNVAILLTPEQTQVVRLADALGDLDLATRNKNDTEIVNTPEMIDSLLREMNGSTLQAGNGQENSTNVPAYAVAQMQAATPQIPFQGANVVAQQPFLPPKSMSEPPKPQNKGSILDFFGLSGNGDKKEKSKKVNPSWSVQVYTGDEVANIEFELLGKSKDDWKYKVAKAPELAPQAPPKPAAALATTDPEPVTSEPIDPNSIGNNPDNSKVLDFLNEIGWSKSKEPTDDDTEEAATELQNQLNPLLSQ